MSDEDKTESAAEVEAAEEATSEVEQPEKEAQQDSVETETTDQKTPTDESNEEAAPKENAAWASMRAENKRLKEAVAQSQVDADYLKELEGLTGKQEYEPQYRQEQLAGMDDNSREISVSAMNGKGKLTFTVDGARTDHGVMAIDSSSPNPNA